MKEDEMHHIDWAEYLRRTDHLPHVPPEHAMNEVWTENHFFGNPPDGYDSWSDWCSSKVKRGCFIRALDKL